MKVGILTHYNVNNQGAQLQMLALTKQLEKMGCDVYTLTYNKNFDFVDESIQKRNIITIKSIPYILREFLFKKGLKLTYFNYKKYKINKKFRLDNFKYLKYTSANLDAAFVGSDEVFSTEVGYNAMMYGHGVETKNMFSYAPSFGQTNIERLKKQNIYELVKAGLNSFDNLSARDENTKNIIETLTDKKATRVCDPVLLYDFNNINTKIKKVNKKYLIVYGYDKNFTDKEEINAIKKYAKSKKLITVSVGTFHKWCDKNISCNCLEWIEYFRNCEEVITDTFHGTILSIITNKPVAIFVRKKINQNKLTDLANILKIDDRIVKTISFDSLTMMFNKKMDYTMINNNLNILRKNSLEYIEECLNIVTEKANNIEDLPRHCNGCGACVNICPQKAINYELNENGFFEAKIDKSKCINCGLCKKVCVRSKLKNNSLIELKNGKLYSATCKDTNTLKNCTSGGVAYELGKWAINNGYYVSGVIYDKNNMIAKSIVTNRIDEFDKTKGSKYLQSKSNQVIEKIINIIKKDKSSKFMVFGTPCQIYGLKQLIKFNKFENEIIYIDLFCHGVPSYKVYYQYLKENKIDNVEKIEFRNKINGWHNYTMRIETTSKKYYFKSERSNFYKAFFDNALLNECCATCLFRKHNTVSDIRLGDFWGPRYKKDNKGVSAIIINSEIGFDILQKIQDTLKIKEIKDINDCLKYQNKKDYNINNMHKAQMLLNYNSLSKTIRLYRKNMSKKYILKENIKEVISYFPSFIKNKLR